MKVSAYLKTHRWTKGSMSLETDCCCLGLAIEECYISYIERNDVIRRVLDYIAPDYYGIMHWNDAPERTYVDVLKIVKDLDI